MSWLMKGLCKYYSIVSHIIIKQKQIEVNQIVLANSPILWIGTIISMEGLLNIESTIKNLGIFVQTWVITTKNPCYLVNQINPQTNRHYIYIYKTLLIKDDNIIDLHSPFAWILNASYWVVVSNEGGCIGCRYQSLCTASTFLALLHYKLHCSMDYYY